MKRLRKKIIMSSNNENLNNSLYKSLCSLDILYRQVKFYHWIVNGENYISNHRFLDEISDLVNSKIDLIAERLVFLGFIPEYEPNVVEKNSDVKYFIQTSVTMNEIIDKLIKQFNIVIDNLKDSAEKSTNDYGTQQLITEVIYDLEVYKHHINSFK
jgi:DNA-binding ferritin-like protein (oxidative damage protectant)